MHRLRIVLAIEIALALLALYLSALPWLMKIVAGLCIVLCSKVPRKPRPSRQTVLSSWGIFYQGVAYFPHQFSSPAQYHAMLLRLKFKETASAA